MKQILLLLVLLLVSTVTAQSNVEDTISFLNEELQGQELPEFAQGLFGDEKIVLHIGMETSVDVEIGIITSDGKFEGIGEGLVESPTLRVYTTEVVLRDILESSDPFSAFQTALDTEDITYEAVGLVNSIKFGIISFFLGLF